MRWRDATRSWSDHIAGAGYVDEVQLLQPVVFPAFVAEFLGFRTGENLAPELSGEEGRPDFTPADSVTHPFVFETKSTNAGTDLRGFEQQVKGYLDNGKPRIRRVVLTNLVGLRVFELSDSGELTEAFEVNLKGLLLGDPDAAASTTNALQLARFLDEFRFRELTSEEKLARVREASAWNAIVEVTNPDWLSTRIDRVVVHLANDVGTQIGGGALQDPSRLGDSRRDRIVDELRFLEWRLGTNPEVTAGRDLQDYLTASPSGPAGRALLQYVQHVAYYVTTRLLLVRLWEDLGLLEPMLYDGGFDKWMDRFDSVVRKVVIHSFDEARSRYRALFEQENNYTWYEPTEDAYADAIYELANTYLGSLESDVLGIVYERLLERVDRKILGQYYTPRDVIRLMWDLLRPEDLKAHAEADSRPLRVLDIATGSGGFLVELAARLRRQLETSIRDGSSASRQDFINDLAAGLVGVEKQTFPAYLAELNLLVQMGQSMSEDKNLRVPPLGIITADTLGLHNPDELFPDPLEAHDVDLLSDAADRVRRAELVRNPAESGFWMDVACGNPPYVGEKSAAAILRATREEHPYWNQFVGPHLDYLYWFLILGVSKLRVGGRFAFITTEYWLRAQGARPLRAYLASRCRLDRIILFRNMRLFPDAPGQHSMIVVGQRSAEEDQPHADTSLPTVSIYEGPSLPERERARVLEAIEKGSRRAAGVVTFRSSVSPGTLEGKSWSAVTLTRKQYSRRQRLSRFSEPLSLDTDEGVISGADKMTPRIADQLPGNTVAALGGRDSRAGIFVLSKQEVGQLGVLNDEERALLLPLVNTRNVLPYAAILPPDPPHIAYLAAPERDASQTREQIQNMAFPDGLPRLCDHIVQFRPLLQRKVEGYGEKRPWWTLHRPRPDIAGHMHGSGSWANYALTTRWGAGQRLVVGLAPTGSLPASGLHALFSPTADAAYLVGLMNSTPVQELADTLPPGEVRVEDLRELNLPMVSEVSGDISSSALDLAAKVHDLVTRLAPAFPGARDALLDDLDLAVLPEGAWLPNTPPGLATGNYGSVTWVQEMTQGHGQAVPIVDVRTAEELWGHMVIAQGPGRSHFTIHLGHASEDLAAAVQSHLFGLKMEGTRLSDLPNCLVPIRSDELVVMRQRDVDSFGD